MSIFEKEKPDISITFLLSAVAGAYTSVEFLHLAHVL